MFNVFNMIRSLHYVFSSLIRPAADVRVFKTPNPNCRDTARIKWINNAVGYSTRLLLLIALAIQTIPAQERAIGFLGIIPVPVPTLGTYPNTSIPLSSNTTITPGAAPTGTTSITVSTSTSFNGEFEADVVTGVVRLTNAQPAKLPPGAYTVTVKAFGAGGSTTKTFTLTVTTPPACAGITFASPSAFTVGPNPRSVAVGDFNRDGKQDIAAANSVSNNVSILIGDGAGSFATAVNFGVGSTPLSVAVGDFNGDGKQDLVTANYVSTAVSDVSILIGDGAGSFATAVNFGVGTGPDSVAVSDFNGDGKQDIAAANFNSNTISILIGDGAGSFATAVNFGVGSAPDSVAVGDFNGDGRQDLAAANANNVSILIGNGAGSFAAATDFGVGTNPVFVAVGDFNGDGNQDLAAANRFSQNVSILIGNGAGSFTTANFNVGGSLLSAVAVGDFNGDGKQDLVTADDASSNVSVLIGDGAGSFAAAVGVPVGGTFAVAVGDFNGDGKQDLVVAMDGSDKVSILLRTCPAQTAAGVSVSGRVLTSGGRGLRNAGVVLTDSQGVARRVPTRSFGTYRFDDVEVGQTYILSVRSKLYQYSPKVLAVMDELSDVDFVPFQARTLRIGSKAVPGILRW